AIFREPDSHAAHVLAEHGVTRLDVVTYLSHGVAKVPEMPAPGGAEESEDEDEDEEGGARRARDPLSAFTVNLIERAAAGRIDPLIGRSRELERTIHVLCRRRKNNPIYVGDPGVGKTAIVEGFALRVQENRVPAALRDVQVYALDMGALLAGTKFRGEFEARLKAVIAALVARPGAILFIDVIHEAGAAARSQTTGRQKKTVRTRDIEHIVATMAKIPPRQVTTSDRDRLQTLDRDIKLLVFGQDVAVDTVVSAIRLARAGLGQPDKPVGSFLFCGPTGVGKTEVAKQLAAALGVEF